jgi:hypothetical protein
VIEGDLIVTDDLVVEVGDIERAIFTKAEVYGTEPGVLAGHEIRLLYRNRGGASIFDPIVIDHRIDGIADEHPVVPFPTPLVTVNKGNSTDSGGAMGVLDHGGSKAHPVVRLPEARVKGPADQLVDRGAVAVCAVEVSPLIEAETKGVHLPMAPDLNA